MSLGDKMMQPPSSHGCYMGSRSSASLASATERGFLMRNCLGKSLAAGRHRVFVMLSCQK